MNTQTQQPTKDQEINAFAIWFGKVLVELRQHDLKLQRQPREHPSYAKAAWQKKLRDLPTSFR